MQQLQNVLIGEDLRLGIIGKFNVGKTNIEIISSSNK
jgi:hypothetical protein